MAMVRIFNLQNITDDLLRIVCQLNCRGLQNSVKWCAELRYCLADTLSGGSSLPNGGQSRCDASVEPTCILAKTYFDNREYDRAAFITRDCKMPETTFLHYYSRYLAGEKRCVDNATDTAVQDDEHMAQLTKLHHDLQKCIRTSKPDAFCLYLYAVLLKRLDLGEEALPVLQEAINLEPLHWGTWLELTALISTKEQLEKLNLPEHWMKQFFLAHVYTVLQMPEEALQVLETLRANGFESSNFVRLQTAKAYNISRDVEQAIAEFEKVYKSDPYCLDSVDVYSNLLHITENRKELAYLAHRCCEIDKYRPETCCVLANYYSLRMNHFSAVEYFQRALKLNPNYQGAWTLMGHEYIELKNSASAIQAYRRATEIDPHDFRAWYGLGQVYELMQLPTQCLYYYQEAQRLRPKDSRMAVALGEAYLSLLKIPEAKKCFWKAYSMGDIEGTALLKLANLFKEGGPSEADQAAAAYTDYIDDVINNGMPSEPDHLFTAYLFLAKHHLKRSNLEDAYAAALKCTEFPLTREEGKRIIREIGAASSDDQQQRDGEDSMSDNAAKTPYQDSGQNIGQDILSKPILLDGQVAARAATRARTPSPTQAVSRTAADLTSQSINSGQSASATASVDSDIDRAQSASSGLDGNGPTVSPEQPDLCVLGTSVELHDPDET